MKTNTFTTLEYDQIIKTLATYTKTSLGKQLAFQLKPCMQKETVEILLSETEEARNLFMQKGNLPFDELPDITLSLKRLESNRNALYEGFTRT